MADFQYDDGNDDDGGQPTGKGLRAQLEQALAENQTLKQTNHKLAVEAVVANPDLRLVRVEDLAGVPVDKVAEHAKALQEERQKVQTDLLRDVLARQGFAETELEAMVAEYTQEKQAASSEVSAADRVRAIGRLDAAPVPAVNGEKLHGRDAIVAALEANASKRRH